MATRVENLDLQYPGMRKTSCCDKGCRGIISNRTPHYIFKGEDLVDDDQSICDCLIFQNTDKVVAVELKGKRLDPEQIQTQLQNGVDKASEIMNRLGSNEFNFDVILLADSYPDRLKFEQLKSMSVVMRNKRRKIVLKECGYCLDEYL